MSGLVEFLRARYTEAREREEGLWTVRRCLPFEWIHVFDWGHEYYEVGDFKKRVSVEDFQKAYGEPAADPDVLADLDAKLAILDEHPATRDVITVKPDGMHGFGCATCHQDEGMIVGEGWCRTLRLLAVPFAAHPDYDERWRP